MEMRHLGWLYVVATCAIVLCIAAPLTAQATKPNDSVNIELKDTEVRSAIEVLFRNTGRNFSVDQNVQGTIAALSIKDVPFDTALKSLSKSAGLVYRVDGGVYIISKKPDAVPESISAAQPLVDTTPIEDTTVSEIRIEKIPLNNVSASEILSILNGENRQYGGYGLGNGYGYGNYGNNRYGGGYGNGYGNYGTNYQGGYNGYGRNNGSYGNYGNYGSRGYGGYPSGLPGGMGGGYGYRGW